MNCKLDRYKMVCKREFADMHRKLDRVDEAIRGNGKIGILRRLDRIEQIEAGRKRTHWLIVGAAVTAGASAVLELIQFLMRGGH